MIRPSKALKMSLRLVSGSPLHLFAAFFAAIISDFLMTTQPLFLRVFIDQSQAGVERSKLWLFPIFMASAAALAYAFDYISVAIRFFLHRRVTQLLQEVFLDFGDKQRAEVVQLSLRHGISSLSALALSLTIDFALIVMQIGLIVLFLSLDQPLIGGCTVAVLALSALAASRNTSRVGRVSRTIEIIRNRMISLAGEHPESAKRLLGRLYRFDAAQFNLKSLNVLLSFFIFRVLPVGVLLAYLFGWGVSFGSLASSFLYFSMLRSPYNDLVALLQESGVSFSESELFAAEFERGLALHGALSAVPFGLLWRKTAERSGTALSRAGDGGGCREYFDDVESGRRKDELLELLRRRSRAGSICVNSTDEAMRRFAHFVARDGRAPRTILAEAAA